MELLIRVFDRKESDFGLKVSDVVDNFVYFPTKIFWLVPNFIST